MHLGAKRIREKSTRPTETTRATLPLGNEFSRIVLAIKDIDD
jgi:hypothetical protein